MVGSRLCIELVYGGIEKCSPHCFSSGLAVWCFCSCGIVIVLKPKRVQTCNLALWCSSINNFFLKWQGFLILNMWLIGRHLTLNPLKVPIQGTGLGCIIHFLVMGTHKFCSILIGYFSRTLIKSFLILTTSYAGCPEPKKNPCFIIFIVYWVNWLLVS